MNTTDGTIRAVNETLAETGAPDMAFLRQCVECFARANDERAELCVDDIVSILEQRGLLYEADELATAYVADDASAILSSSA